MQQMGVLTMARTHQNILLAFALCGSSRLLGITVSVILFRLQGPEKYGGLR